VTDVGRLPRLGAPARAALAAAAEGRDGFLLEGPKAIADALRRPAVRVRRVWLSDRMAAPERDDLLVAAAARAVPVGVAAEADLRRASATVSPQGALAVVDDAAAPPRAVLAASRATALLLDGVQDPGNVGAILRVAAAFDAAGVLLDPASAHPLGAKALRASAGCALAVPFSRAPLESLLAAVAEARRPLWLLEGGGRDVFEAKAPEGLVLAIGSEGSGASALVRAAATERVGIPISPRVESLNAAVAAGIAVAALARRS